MAEGDTKPARAEAKFGQGFLTDIWYFAALSSDLKPGKLARPIARARRPLEHPEGQEGVVVGVDGLEPSLVA